MQQIKTLANAIDQATSDALQTPNLELYNNVQRLVNSRADMPKHCIIHVSKRIMIKNKKVIFLILDLLEYVSYQTELSFFMQIATKDFLLKISGLLQAKDLDQNIKNKILCTIRCWQELFKPHQDLLPLFFQFYDGLIKKGFDQKLDYYSPYRPKQLKKYPTKAQIQKKNASLQNNPKKSQQPASKPKQKQINTNSNESLLIIRQQIILTNQIIDGCDPSEGVKGKTFLNQLLAALKQSEKSLTKVINESTSQKVMEEAIALNDDLIITYRRYKELQKNKRPQPFIKTQLQSNFAVKQPQPLITKIETKNSNIVANNNSLFQNFQQKFNQVPTKLKQQTKPKQIDILSLDELNQVKKQIPKNNTNNNADIFEMLDLNSQNNMNTNSTPIQLQPIYGTNQLPNQFGTNNAFGQQQSQFGFGQNMSNINQFQNQNKVPVGNVFQQNQSFVPNNNFNTLLLNNPPVQPITFGTLNNSGKDLQSQFKTQADFKPYSQDSVNSLVDLTDLFSKKL